MLLFNALKAVSPGGSSAITRPGGPMILVNRHMSVKVLRPKGLYDWRPCFGDFVAEDWHIVDLEELGRQMGEAQGGGK